MCSCAHTFLTFDVYEVGFAVDLPPVGSMRTHTLLTTHRQQNALKFWYLLVCWLEWKYWAPQSADVPWKSSRKCKTCWNMQLLGGRHEIAPKNVDHRFECSPLGFLKYTMCAWLDQLQWSTWRLSWVLMFLSALTFFLRRLLYPAWCCEWDYVFLPSISCCKQTANCNYVSMKTPLIKQVFNPVKWILNINFMTISGWS